VGFIFTTLFDDLICAVSFHSGNANIIISEKDLFDYSRGEPAPELPTVLRALDVSIVSNLFTLFMNILSDFGSIRVTYTDQSKANWANVP